MTLKHKLSEKQSITVGYEFYNFDSHEGGSFDDYLARGGFFGYECIF